MVWVACTKRSPPSSSEGENHHPSSMTTPSNGERRPTAMPRRCGGLRSCRSLSEEPTDTTEGRHTDAAEAYVLPAHSSFRHMHTCVLPAHAHTAHGQHRPRRCTAAPSTRGRECAFRVARALSVASESVRRHHPRRPRRSVGERRSARERGRERESA